MVFLWLQSVELAVSRVVDRVKIGGHSVPEDTIRRRYVAGLRNFFNLYLPMADYWRFYDNSDASAFSLLAMKSHDETTINDKVTWQYLLETYSE